MVAVYEVADEAQRTAPYHIHKITLFMAAMRHFAQYLVGKVSRIGDKIFQTHNAKIDDADNTLSIV